MHHIKGVGCPQCNNTFLYNFKELANTAHGGKYDYSLVNYKNNYTSIKIVCSVHGVFRQLPKNHLNRKNSCPHCQESRGEKEIANILSNKGIFFERQKTFEKCRNKYPLPFDFYLPEINMCIEYDGIQHFIANSFFGDEDGLSYTQRNDDIKTKFCLENNIGLIRIRYDEDVEDKMFELITI